MADDAVEPFLRELRQAGSAERAAWDRRYHKSSREHWGVTARLCDAAVRARRRGFDRAAVMSLAQALWETDVFDAMIAAARLLALPDVGPGADLWTLVKRFMRDVDGWALEDNLARVAWKCLLADERLLDDLESWTAHESFWMRRAALIFTLPYAKPGRSPERMLRWAAFYAADPEWFIQKAIGWWLRDLGAHDPDRVLAFLHAHWDDLGPVAKREATRKLRAALRARLPGE